MIKEYFNVSNKALASAIAYMSGYKFQTYTNNGVNSYSFEKNEKTVYAKEIALELHNKNK